MQNSLELKVGDIVFTAERDGVVAEASVSRVVDEGFFAEVSIKKGGEVLWESGYVAESHETFAFGTWFDGSGLPVIWSDIDEDGKLELVAPTPKGDLSPTVFRVYRWTGEELVFVKRRSLIQNEQGTGFRWASWDEIPDECVWLDSVDRSGEAERVSLGNSGTVTRDKIQVELAESGFKVSSPQ